MIRASQWEQVKAQPSLFLDNRISQDTIPVKYVNLIFAHWCFLPLFATIYAKGGESNEENHHPAAGAFDERVFGGKACRNTSLPMKTALPKFLPAEALSR